MDILSNTIINFISYAGAILIIVVAERIIKIMDNKK